MAYPTSDTTYKLPFDGKVRVSSKRRFILVRWFSTPEARPFIRLRSDSLDTLRKSYDARNDYIIDQVTGRVTYHFNGHEEAFNGHTGRDEGRTGSYTANTLYGRVTL